MGGWKEGVEVFESPSEMRRRDSWKLISDGARGRREVGKLSAGRW